MSFSQISMTNDQIHSILLSDIEDVKIHIPKKNGPSNSKFKLVFVQFNSANEAKLCMKLINRLGYQNVEACYSDRQVRSNSEDPKEAIDSRSCEYCGRIASEYVCGNCHTSYSSAYYCSKDHQERDWQQHKQDCKRIPELKRIDGQDTVTETVALTKDSDRFNSESTEVPVNPQDFSKRGKYYIKTSDFGMAQGSIVNISAVINSRILYVHPVSKEYKELMRFLQHHVSSAPFLSEKPAINEYVLAPFLGTYHRARILECGPDTMKVHLTDIGQELSCNWQEFKHLNYKVRGKPSYTHKVILNDVKNLEMTDLVKNYLNGLCSQKMDLEIVEIFAVHTTEKKVVLKDVNTSAIINTTINYIYSGTSKSFYDVNLFNFFFLLNIYFTKFCPFQTAKVPRFSTETPVKVFIADCSQLDDQSLLSCIPNDQFPEYFHLIDELKKYMNKLPSEIYVPTE